MDEMIKEGAVENTEVQIDNEPTSNVEAEAAVAVAEAPEAEAETEAEAECAEPVLEEKTEEQLLREAEEAEKARKAKIAAIWDKVTTGLLIALMASPLLILLYIFIWFMAA